MTCCCQRQIALESAVSKMAKMLKAILVQGLRPSLWKSIHQKYDLLESCGLFHTRESVPDKNISPLSCLTNMSHGIKPPRKGSRYATLRGAKFPTTSLGSSFDQPYIHKHTHTHIHNTQHNTLASKHTAKHMCKHTHAQTPAHVLHLS